MNGFHISIFTTAFFLMIAFTRLLRRTQYVRRHLAPERRHRAVIVGSGNVARELADALTNHASQKYEVIGILAPEMEEVTGTFPGASPEDTLATVGVTEYLLSRQVDQVYLTTPNSGDPDVVRLVRQCRQAGMSVAFVPHDYELFITRSVLRDIGGIPLVAIDGRKPAPSTLYFRPFCDAAIAALVLLLAAPLFLIIAGLLALVRTHPVRGLARCGAKGRQFTLYNFNIRTDAQAPWFDRLLRFSLLVHLPELWNVVRAEMSLVGPRPETAERARHYTEWEKQRFNVTPGITGYAQIYGLQGKRFAAEKARHDTRYISGWSPLLDFAMIVQTLWCIFRRMVLAALRVAVPDGVSQAGHYGVEVAGANSSQPSTD